MATSMSKCGRLILLNVLGRKQPNIVKFRHNFGCQHTIRQNSTHKNVFEAINANAWKKTVGKFSLGLAATAGIASLTLWNRQSLGITLSAPKVAAAEICQDSDNISPRQKFNFIADVVEKAAPAVVYIEILGRDPFSGRMRQVSNGSGFIAREDGLILTNAHVVANKQKVMVKLKDGRNFEGYVQAVDPVSDLATVKINASGLPTLKLGKSSDLRPGEWVVAMGSPFALNNTVTAGIVSTTERGSKELGLNNDIAYIQTDAVINFGNSGGPLINLDGEAIGINSMKVTTGISFAIPSDYIQNFVNKARNIEQRAKSTSWFGTTGKPKRRYLGITMLTLNPSIIAELRTRLDTNFPDVQNGILIHKIVIGSPAHNAGIQVGDIITEINDKSIQSASDVYTAIEAHQELKLTIRRGNEQTMHIKVIPEDVS